MSVTRLLLLLFVAISFGRAFSDDRPQPRENSLSLPANPETASDADLGGRVDQQLRLPDNVWIRIRSLPPEFGFGATCFAMRTYLVEQDAPDSDSVHPVGYTTCQPASRSS